MNFKTLKPYNPGFHLPPPISHYKWQVLAILGSLRSVFPPLHAFIMDFLLIDELQHLSLSEGRCFL